MYKFVLCVIFDTVREICKFHDFFFLDIFFLGFHNGNFLLLPCAFILAIVDLERTKNTVVNTPNNAKNKTTNNKPNPTILPCSAAITASELGDPEHNRDGSDATSTQGSPPQLNLVIDSKLNHDV